MDILLTKIKDLKEQLIFVAEIILDSSLVQMVLMDYQIHIQVLLLLSDL